MSKDPSHFLNELPIWKLKLVAKEYGIDVSSCRYKRDYVEKIGAKKLTEEQVRQALSKSQKESAKAEDASEEMKEIGRDIQNIAERPAEPKDIPAEEEKTLDRHLDEALTMKPSFFQVDSANEDAFNKMLLGDYHEAIKANRDARIRCLDLFSGFQVYSSAVSIRAAEELLAKLPTDRVDVRSGLKTSLAAAKMAFVHGTPRQREETVESLEALATRAYEVYWGESNRAENEIVDLLRDYESFGTRTEEARRYLEIAASAKRSHNLEEYARMLAQAREAAEKAKSSRATELEGAYHIVRAATDEARESGASLPDAEKGLADAKEAMKAGSFARAVELMADIERAADAAHNKRLKADKELEKAKVELARSVETNYGPVINEAASYGLDVREPTFHAGNMRTALDREDVVNASKFARRVKEIMDGMERDLDRKRIEAGVAVRVPNARCGKCKKKTLYAFPGSVRKCMSCGHSFSVPQVKAEPKAVVKADQQVRSAEPPPKPVPEEKTAPPEKKKRWFRW
ncbi:MAG: hypothetical protein JW880_01275 [Candidatus Thermoplasmatota archaeon]|nr:hypothetical protein [Candidatus Thermoplasmatota archaeon]